MRVTALGTADAFCSSGRGHTAWLVDDERGTYAVDFGATALLALRRLGRDPQDLGAVHFTHLHGDPIAGWPFLLIDAVHRAHRTGPLAVTGPSGTGARLHDLWTACYASSARRGLPFPLEVTELSPGESGRFAGRDLRAFAAAHMRPPEVALSLRIGPLAFTGDTGAVPDGLCEGAAMACIECTWLGPSTGRHLGWETLRENLPRVPRILLAHLGAEARSGIVPPPGVQVCEDLDFVEL